MSGDCQEINMVLSPWPFKRGLGVLAKPQAQAKPRVQPIDALVNLVVWNGLFRLAPVRFDFDNLAHLRRIQPRLGQNFVGGLLQARRCAVQHGWRGLQAQWATNYHSTP
jgi:hypothetical protein